MKNGSHGFLQQIIQNIARKYVIISVVCWCLDVILCDLKISFYFLYIKHEEYSNLYLLYIVYHLRIQYYFLLFY